MRKDPSILPKTYTVHRSPSLPQSDLQSFARVTMHWAEKLSVPQGLLNTDSELTLIPGDPKHLAIHQSEDGGQMINGIVAQLCLSVSQSVSANLFCGYIGTDILSN